LVILGVLYLEHPTFLLRAVASFSFFLAIPQEDQGLMTQLVVNRLVEHLHHRHPLAFQIHYSQQKGCHHRRKPHLRAVELRAHPHSHP